MLGKSFIVRCQHDTTDELCKTRDMECSFCFFRSWDSLQQRFWSQFIYRKILKISPGAYIFQRPFLRGLYSEGLIYGICFSKSIGLALQLEVTLPFLLSFTLYLREIFQVQAPGALIFGGVI